MSLFVPLAKNVIFIRQIYIYFNIGFFLWISIFCVQWNFKILSLNVSYLFSIHLLTKGKWKSMAASLDRLTLASTWSIIVFKNEGCLIVPFFLYSVGLITTSCSLQLLKVQRVNLNIKQQESGCLNYFKLRSQMFLVRLSWQDLT